MTLHRLKDFKYIDYPWWIVTCLVLQARQAGTSLLQSALSHALLGKSLQQLHSWVYRCLVYQTEVTCRSQWCCCQRRTEAADAG